MPWSSIASSPLPDLPGIEQQRVGSGPLRLHIVDRAGAAMEPAPGALPRSVALKDVTGAARPFDRHQQHRRRTQHLHRDAKYRPCLGAIEQHAELGDITRRADLLLLDDDPRHHRIERRIGHRRAVPGQPLRQHLPALALRQPPAALPRRVGILAAHVDHHAVDFEVARGRIDRILRRRLRAPFPALGHDHAGTRPNHR